MVSAELILVLDWRWYEGGRAVMMNARAKEGQRNFMLAVASGSVPSKASAVDTPFPLEHSPPGGSRKRLSKTDGRTYIIVVVAESSNEDHPARLIEDGSSESASSPHYMRIMEHTRHQPDIGG